MSPVRVAVAALASVLAGALAACAGAPQVASGWQLRSLLAHDDGRAEGEVAFPNFHHESVVRFPLPEGEHRLARVWVRLAAPGTLRAAVYGASALEGPGELLFESTQALGPEDASAAEEGRWWTIDLTSLRPQKGVVWVGFKKSGGDPKIWASRSVGDHYFVRSTHPSAPLELLPVRRTPLIRLELQR
jgi:hypothetical protein